MTLRPLFCAVFAAVSWGAPALAASTPAPTPEVPTLMQAQTRIHNYLQTLKLPPDVVVAPASGDIPWPGSPMAEGVRAEVWTAFVGGKSTESARPFLMFAIRPDTGEVYVLHMRPLIDPVAPSSPTTGRP